MTRCGHLLEFFFFLFPLSCFFLVSFLHSADASERKKGYRRRERERERKRERKRERERRERERVLIHHARSEKSEGSLGDFCFFVPRGVPANDELSDRRSDRIVPDTLALTRLFVAGYP